MALQDGVPPPAAVSPASESDSGHSISGLEPYSPVQGFSSLQLEPEEERCAAQLLAGIPNDVFGADGPTGRLESLAAFVKSLDTPLPSNHEHTPFVDYAHQRRIDMQTLSEKESSQLENDRAQMLNAALGGKIVGVEGVEGVDFNWSVQPAAFLDADVESDASSAEYLASPPL